jgi:uncharacterized membrane protein
MEKLGQSHVGTTQVANDLSIGDLRAALSAGWRDYTAQPLFGLFFGGIYVAAGLLVYYVLFTQGEVAWLIPATAGFPLIAPFVAVGLYEVSRRREQGLPMSWGKVLGALRGRGDEQILSMGLIVFVAFGFWLMIAHGIWAIFLAEAGVGSENFEFLFTPTGLMMLAVGTPVGALIALAFYSITVISLPMLVDREVDFLTAIITSLAVIRSNRFVMVAWAALIALILFIAMLPLFLGLFVALPVLGHATWHLYRRAVDPHGV